MSAGETTTLPTYNILTSKVKLRKKTRRLTSITWEDKFINILSVSHRHNCRIPPAIDKIVKLNSLDIYWLLTTLAGYKHWAAWRVQSECRVSAESGDLSGERECWVQSECWLCAKWVLRVVIWVERECWVQSWLCAKWVLSECRASREWV